ncbi:hypothetical protein A4U64_09515 [Rhodococcus sp. WB1]|uniref:transposase n=1 Tax=Rhodococcus sp. DMU1 TaxID=2722825 RepID=UPI00081A72DB|nr:transposase [Rhodococcus sp. DMU1]ANZ24903.1 hypothetical protein A4U64_09515 [Rhodococcus sp. WB1]
MYGRGTGRAQLIPGRQYSFVAALEPGRTSWTAVFDAVRLQPDDDETLVTARQVRSVVERLRAAGQHRDGDPDILLIFDAGFDLPRLAVALTDLPGWILGRMRGDRVSCFPAPPRHGPQFRFADLSSWPTPAATTSTVTGRYGTATASAWNQLNPRLIHQGVWAEHPGALPIVEGTVIPLTVGHLPGNRHPAPVWLWYSDPTVGGDHVDGLWQMFLRRFFPRAHLRRSSSRRRSGLRRRSAVPRRPIAGPGSSSWRMPSCGSPGPWPRTCADPGSDRGLRAG